MKNIGKISLNQRFNLSDLILYWMKQNEEYIQNEMIV